MNDEITQTAEQASAIMDRIAEGMALEKCRSCGCMLTGLEVAERAFNGSESSEVRALLQAVKEYKAQMAPITYDCLGCKVCWGAEATNLVAEAFGDFTTDCCDGACTVKVATNSGSRDKLSWPHCPGEYLVGDPSGPIAVCTLASRDLPASLMAMGEPGIAIAGKCDTENIGVEKVVLNIIANPHIRRLILCGNEAEGHRSGDALLKLQDYGVDASMRIRNATAWRPVLKNLTMLDVARFRQQVEVVNLIGNTDLSAVTAMLRECTGRPFPPIAGFAETPASHGFERIRAHAPQRLELDPAGFFIILPNRATGVMVCEHYENNGKLAHVIEGKEAALIAATAVEHGLVTRLDHAAYLGRELAKAELSIKTGTAYTQDAALGELPQDEPCSGSNCTCH